MGSFSASTATRLLQLVKIHHRITFFITILETGLSNNDLHLLLGDTFEYPQVTG